jgi:hypothetical protein
MKYRDKLAFNSAKKYFWKIVRQWLVLCSSVVTICTTKFKHSNILCFVITYCLCVSCGSQNKQQLFPYTELTDWYLKRDIVFTVRYGECIEDRLINDNAIKAFPWLRRSVAGVWIQRPKLDSNPIHLGFFGAESVILEVFIWVLLLYPLCIIPPMPRNHPQIKSHIQNAETRYRYNYTFRRAPFAPKSDINS